MLNASLVVWGDTHLLWTDGDTNTQAKATVYKHLMNSKTLDSYVELIWLDSTLTHNIGGCRVLNLKRLLPFKICSRRLTLSERKREGWLRCFNWTFELT